ncbi:TetR family transcriptional regulator [Brevibacterium sanguinis]|uniref:TetR family transcriptional regulator n=2 Tax=Brevibacterium TaxID=1696 RepID=A0A366IQR2_9MICO|nr:MULTISPECIES: TetR family transcriptional regulator [Brevibacterium]RBP61719.1 TetR family transcriptional regulator [Brevibacterium sanguinis]RBP74300.1 TetR family transcriptional regulator [Brevibacterium celere]
MTSTGNGAEGDSGTLGSRVRSAIRAAGVNNSEVARRIGIEPSKLSKSLAGTRKFRVEELSGIAALTNVTTDWLTTGRVGEPPRRRIVTNPAAPTLAATTSATPTITGDTGSERWLSKGKRNRHRIIATAWELYADHGIDNVPTSDVAAACGLSVSTINYHFRTKTQLLEAALRHSLTIIATTRNLTAPDDPIAALRHFSWLHAGVDQKVRRVWSIWLQSWSRAVVDERSRLNLAAVYTEWLDLVTGVIVAGQRAGAVRSGNTTRMVKSLSIFIDGLGVARATGQIPITDEEALEMLEDYLNAHILLKPDEPDELQQPEGER